MLDQLLFWNGAEPTEGTFAAALLHFTEDNGSYTFLRVQNPNRSIFLGK